MKKTTYCLILCFVLLLLFLTACGGKEKSDLYTDTVEYQGKTYVIEYVPNSTRGTITVEGMVCEFGVSGSAEHTKFEVTYPDGSHYSRTEFGNSWGSGMSEDYDPPSYAKGDVLWEVLDAKNYAEKESRGGQIFLGLLVAGLGLLNVIRPKTAWYVNHGWRYKNAEPSETALLFGALGGIVAILLGLGMIFLG